MNNKITSGQRPTRAKLARRVKMPLSARENLRKRYRPDRVRILFVGESPPASGRFFYQADSGLYRAIRDTFVVAFPTLREREFLESFCRLGCYLVDLCDEPVDQMMKEARHRQCRAAEVQLDRKLRELRPETIVTVVRSIASNVRRAEEQAGWSGVHIELPYPGRWHQYRREFSRRLVPLLRTSTAVTSVTRESPQIVDEQGYHRTTM